jgi:hypothetical protein
MADVTLTLSLQRDLCGRGAVERPWTRIVPLAFTGPTHKPGTPGRFHGFDTLPHDFEPQAAA